MTYEARPTPGFDYLVYLTISAALSFAGLYYALVKEAPSEKEFQYYLAGLVVVGCLFLAWSVYGAIRTEYRLDEENLELRRGNSVRTVVLDSIESILLVGTNWPALGLGFHSKNFCNRLTGGIRLTTTEGKYYISPTNPHLFSNHIRNMRFAGPPPLELLPDEQGEQTGESV